MSLIEEHNEILLQTAKKSIQHGLETNQPLPIDSTDYPDGLRQIRATFVTLEINTHLRGCMGTIVAVRPLINDVAYHAYSSAFSDPRFSKLQAEEFPLLDIHISILSEPQTLTFKSEQDLLQQLQPDIDGLILTEGHHRATYLPSVWESIPIPQDFLNQLKRKAGLPSTYWSKTIKIQRYTTETITLFSSSKEIKAA